MSGPASAESSAARQKRRREKVLIGLLLFLVVILTSTEIYLVRQGGQPFTGSLLVFGLININAILFLLFTFLIFRHLTKLFVERRARVFGSRLRTRLVLTFVSLALIPTLFMFFIAWQLISGRLEYQWDKLVKDTLEETMGLGRVFIQGVQDKLHASADLGRRNLETQTFWWAKDKQALNSWLTAFAESYQLTGLEIVTPQGEKIAASSLISRDGKPVPALPPLSADQLAAGGVQRQAVSNGVLISLAEPLKSPPGRAGPAYLVVHQFIPGSLIHRVMDAEGQAQKVRYSQRLLRPVRVSHYLTLVIVTLLTIMSAIWLAFYMAREITTPIRQLAEGTLKVAGGDYDFHIDQKGKDEIGFLVQSFNKMTHDLQASRAELATALGRLRTSLVEQEAQKRYVEILLRNVAAGVIGVDPEGRITNINDSAAQIFRVNREEVLGKPGRSLLPPGEHQELVEFAAAARRSGRTMEKRIHLTYPDKTLYLLLKTTALKDDAGHNLGMVTVIEDLTELERAQRQAAWREVARSIAHEVKNPLTPIKLAAQRLRRRYLGKIPDDGKVFDECTQIISDQVDEIKNLVNEFSRFARLPHVTLAPHDLNALVRDALTLYTEVQPRIKLNFHPDPDLPLVAVDQEQIKRVLLNLVDNALASIPDTGEISLSVRGEPEAERVRVEVADTGVGIAEHDKGRVFEPYFSTKRGGTGLGLAIVQSIIADHQGHIRIEDNSPTGTRFVIELPLRREGG
jgi:two-component system nitrogen regulation sensor histidine kinase NtrY|uniref:histidine kinase n=1 Tax=Desulfobacca acetoxidans TaxID=60893 RepID=A0A7V6DPV8_9BACT